MSQTPLTDQPARELLAYDQGWAALNLMLRAGKSFSGRERNCAFLNLGASGQPRFADVSAASHLDLIDDGRGLACADWDFDGDLDLWASARTAPRVRFIRNDLPAGEGPARWIAFRLQGSRSNRDAIGARVELLLKGGARRVKSLSAGHGHLSQSTKWLIFGLGEGPAPEAAIVHWPGGASERFEAIRRGERYLLAEGTGLPKAVSPPEINPREGSGKPLALPPTGEGGRIVLLDPAPMPEISAATLDGTALDLAPSGQPLLLNLWATWCVPCVAELKEWAAARKEFEGAGLRVVSLSVDEPGDDREATAKKVREFAARLQYPYETGVPGSDLLDTLDTVQLAFIGRQSDLPVPSSFLLDGRGQLVAIYRGPVSSSRILKDLALMDADSGTRLASAIPFPGTWIEPPTPTDAGKIAAKFALKGKLEEAAHYVETVMARNAVAPGLITKGEAASLHRVRAAVLHDLGRFGASLESWTEIQRLAPSDPSVPLEMARCYQAIGDINGAIGAFEAALALRRAPESLYEVGKLYAGKGEHVKAVSLFEEALDQASTAPAHFELASSFVGTGRIRDAVIALRAALEIQPGWPPAANNLAWILATCPDAALRSGAEAVTIATLACENSKYQYVSALGTLGAAYAESGDFDKAVEMMDRASALGKKQGLPPSELDRMAAQREVYQTGKPYRDAALRGK